MSNPDPQTNLPAGFRSEVVFGYAFRPFFLLTAAYALLMLLSWGLYLSGVADWPKGLPPRIRHGHEMIFGFAGGAIAGFLLTAVATWTKRPPVSGRTLIALCAAWAAARLGGFLPGQFGWLVWGGASLLFWGGLGYLLAREVIAARNARNYKAIFFLAAFLATETVFFAAGSGHAEWQDACLRTGLFLLLGLISLVGGRIIPAFSQNWLRLNRPTPVAQLPAFDRVDLGAVALTGLFAAGFIIWPKSTLTGLLGLAAALAQAMRVLRWQGWRVGAEPLLWVLHIGYAWMPVGFLLLAMGILGAPGLWDSGIHALTYGAAGTLILGVAARVALGHTGRPLQAFPTMTVAFVSISLGAFCRIVSPVGSPLMLLSVAFWLVAYGLFLMQYVPILLAPSVDADA